MHISTWKESFLLKGSCVSKLFSFRSITISFCFSESIWGQSKSIWFSSSLHLGHPNLSDLISAKNSANTSINQTRTKPYLPFFALVGGRYTKKAFHQVTLRTTVKAELSIPVFVCFLDHFVYLFVRVFRAEALDELLQLVGRQIAILITIETVELLLQFGWILLRQGLHAMYR